MQSQLYIPDKIKIGYQERDDTYTKRLAYVIYYKGKTLMKEKSWSGWIDKGCDGFELMKDENGQHIKNTEADGAYWKSWINPARIREPFSTPEFDNIPTEGFVLNKGVGGTHGRYSWYEFGRIPKIRVYDPRDFEFEITIENMLFILAHNAAFPGKGLEGQFVYAWQGADLILLPIGCKEYQDSKGFTALQSEKVSAKELVPGRTYQNKSQHNLIYLGRFNYYQMVAIKLLKKERYINPLPDSVLKMIKQHVFADAETGTLSFPSGLGRLANCISEDIASNYAELLDSFNNLKEASFPVSLEETPININFDVERTNNRWGLDIANGYHKNFDGTYTHYTFAKQWEDKNEYDFSTLKSKIKHTLTKFSGNKFETKILKDNILTSKPLNSLIKNTYSYGRYSQNESFTDVTREFIESLNLVSVDVVLDNGKKFNLNYF